tara:strand:+ start:2326 stop:4395 length:2070 start_codon:yes stop_codon:yes gene_type:complete
MTRKKTTTAQKTQQPPLDGSYERAATVVPKTANADQRKVQAVVATETPVLMFDWDRMDYVDEILLSDGVQLPDQVPLVDTHRVGSVQDVLGSSREFSVDAQGRILAWNYFADTESARDAWELVSGGYVTDNSVRYRVNDRKSIFIDPGKSRKVRGKTYQNNGDRALKLSTEWELVHNCICPHGADQAAKMRTLDESKKERTMFTKEQLDYVRSLGLSPEDLDDNVIQVFLDQRTAAEPTPAADPTPGPDALERAKAEGIAAEKNRVEQIRDLNAGNLVPADIVERAISTGLNVDQARQLFLESIQANRVEIGAPNVIAGNRSVNARHLEIALCSRARVPEKTLISRHSDQDVNVALEEFQELTLLDVCRASLQFEGKVVPRNKRDMIRAAFSTYTLPQALSNTANVTALMAYQNAPATWRNWCSIGSVADFKAHTRVRVTDMGDLETVENKGTFTHGSAQEEYETITAKTRGKLFAVSRNDIVNDNIDALVRTPAAFGRKAATKISDLVYTSLMANGNMSDGIALFNASHSNLNTSAALTKDTLAAAIQGFRNQTDLDGDPIDVSPFGLLVPPNLENTARSLLESDLLIITGSTNSTVPASNVLRGTMTPIVEPRLENSNFTGNSTTTWYVTGDPSQHDTLEVAFLNGQENPVVEQFDMDPNTLGITYRVYVDVGVAPMDYRTLQKNTA